MVTTRARLLVALLASLIVAPSASASCDPPRCLDAVVPVPPTIVVPDPTVRILLPEGYGSSRLRYPVLYLLHGAGDTFATWTEQTDVEAFSARFPFC